MIFNKEQELITQHDNLILQFPVYWFSCPPLLKQWLDDVFTYGWAYGPAGDKLKNKKVGLAVSLGGSKDNYVHPFTLEATLRPFEMTMKYVNADYCGAFALYGANNEPESPYHVTPEQLNQSAADYIKFLSQL